MLKIQSYNFSTSCVTLGNGTTSFYAADWVLLDFA